MVCPLCFKQLEEDTIYVSPAGDPLQPKFTEFDAPRRPVKPGKRLPVQNERLVSHEGCDCLHPLVSFEGQEDEAAAILNSAHRLDAGELRKCVTGVLDEGQWSGLATSSNDHWSFVRIRYLAQSYSGLKSMWFPERLFPWVDEGDSLLPIFVIGPRKVGKSVFTTLAGSPNSYAGFGDEVRFQQNFGYARPRLAARPYEDYEVLLKNLCAVKFSSAEMKPTEKQSTFIVSTFFSRPLPASEVDTVTLYDIAGEWHERDFSVRAAGISTETMYWCLVITVEDLLVFGGGARESGSSVASAVEKLLSAGEDQRVVIVVSKMDTVEWPSANGSQAAANSSQAAASSSQAAALEQLQQVMEEKGPSRVASEDDEARRAAHQEYGRRGRALLHDLLDPADLREQSLRDQLAGDSRVRAVFFTGAHNWDKGAQYVRPFGIGEAICWMAEDLSNVRRRGAGLLSRMASFVRSRRRSESKAEP